MFPRNKGGFFSCFEGHGGWIPLERGYKCAGGYDSNNYSYRMSTLDGSQKGLIRGGGNHMWRPGASETLVRPPEVEALDRITWPNYWRFRAFFH